MSKQILILPGDGIGPEIMAEAVKVLALANNKFNLNFEMTHDVIGGAAIDKHGVPLADETLERARAADAVLLGAVGGPVAHGFSAGRAQDECRVRSCPI